MEEGESCSYFPHITVDGLREAISGRKEFVESDSEEEKWKRQLLRECRGIAVDNTTGAVVRRSFHKFFNVGELAETDRNVVEEKIRGQKVEIMEKVDGTLVCPLLSDGNWNWCTRMGKTAISDVVAEFVRARPNYERLVVEMNGAGDSVMFEYIAPSSRAYNDEDLVLTGIRNRTSGEYRSFEEVKNLAEKYGISCPKTIDMGEKEFGDFVDWIHDGADGTVDEGVVLKVGKEELFKLKTKWYLDRHKLKTRVSDETEVWMACLKNEIDDITPFVSRPIREKLDVFRCGLLDELVRLTRDIETLAEEVVADVERKLDTRKVKKKKKKKKKEKMKLESSDEEQEVERSRLIGAYINDGKREIDNFLRPLVQHAALHGGVEEVYDKLVDSVISHLEKYKIAKLRHLFNGLKWEGNVLLLSGE